MASGLSLSARMKRVYWAMIGPFDETMMLILIGLASFLSRREPRKPGWDERPPGVSLYAFEVLRK